MQFRRLQAQAKHWYPHVQLEDARHRAILQESRAPREKMLESETRKRCETREGFDHVEDVEDEHRITLEELSLEVKEMQALQQEK